jgi:hypothetical protein
MGNLFRSVIFYEKLSKAIRPPIKARLSANNMLKAIRISVSRLRVFYRRLVKTIAFDVLMNRML